MLTSSLLPSSHFLLHFDTSPPVLSQLSSRLRADPRVVKWTTLKLGDRLDEITPKNTAGGFHDLLDAVTTEQHYARPGQSVMGGGKTIA